MPSHIYLFYPPVCLKVDDYLDAGIDEMAPVSVADLRKHNLSFKQPGRVDPMARKEALDDYVVSLASLLYSPLYTSGSPPKANYVYKLHRNGQPVRL